MIEYIELPSNNRLQGCKIAVSKSLITKFELGKKYCTEKETRRFRKHNWVAFMIVNISELEKGNGELCMVHGNQDIRMVYVRFSKVMLYTVKFLQNGKQRKTHNAQQTCNFASMQAQLSELQKMFCQLSESVNVNKNRVEPYTGVSSSNSKLANPKRLSTLRFTNPLQALLLATRSACVRASLTTTQLSKQNQPLIIQ